MRAGNLRKNADDLVGFPFFLFPVEGNAPLQLRVVSVELGFYCAGDGLAAAPIPGGMAPIRPVGLSIAIDYDDPAIWQEQGQRSTMHRIIS